MFDFIINYFFLLDRLLLYGIKCLAENDSLFYIIMALIPFIGTAISRLTDVIRSNHMSMTERYEKLEQAQTTDISRLLEIYSHEEIRRMAEERNDI